jgi:YVTN family beta-propeller protein
MLVARRRFHRVAISAFLVAIMTSGAIVPATAATVADTWNAKVGSNGINGTARIQAYTSGTGALALKLVKLKPSSSLPVVISKGTCNSVGSTLLTIASIRTTSSGALTRTSSLTAAQVRSIRAATKASGRIAIRIGSSSSRKCGTFVFVKPVIVAPPAAVKATIPVGAYPQGGAIDPTGVWVTNAGDRSLSRIDPATNTVLSILAVDLPGNTVPVAVTPGFGSLWVSFESYDSTYTNNVQGMVQRVDPASGTLIGAPIPVGRQPSVICASPEAIWVSNYADGSVTRIDPALGQVTATVAVGGNPFGLAHGFGSIWVANEANSTVSRIDAITSAVAATVPMQLNGADGVAVGAGSVWVSNFGVEDQPNGTVSRIDPVTNQVAAVIAVGTNPGFVAFGGGYLWVAMYGEPTVVQVDPVKNAVKLRLDVGAENWGIAAGDHTVWAVHPVAAGTNPDLFLPGTVTRIQF